MLPRTTLPRACLSGSGKMKGAASITVRNSTPSGGGRAGKPQTARRNTAWTTTHAMSSHGIVLGRWPESSASWCR
eukprot:664380-Pleurochrysis_carterae.AAC.1